MMKQTFAVKASLFTLILALLAIGTYAAVAVMKKDIVKAVDPQWYQYDGIGDPTDASNYTLIQPQPSPDDVDNVLCPGTREMCAVRALPGSSSHPAAFSSQFQSDINSAIASSTPTEEIKLKN
ncbi:hypothetical protein [Sphingobacterium sp. UBA5996]|uniref:hypothetical protein n=1 Tax=Sphingobacterium sp. UBA5996 TaxID=1947505 RepID=UPI0025E7F8E2|nr:hypothetical protein [Sphingobacterium sp. UBA5996]